MVSLDNLADQFINFLLVEKGLSQKTIEAYSQDLARYLNFLKENSIDDISDTDATVILKHIIELRKSGLEARSRARHIVTLRGFYRFLVEGKNY